MLGANTLKNLAPTPAIFLYVAGKYVLQADLTSPREEHPATQCSPTKWSTVKPTNRKTLDRQSFQSSFMYSRNRSEDTAGNHKIFKEMIYKWQSLKLTKRKTNDQLLI